MPDQNSIPKSASNPQRQPREWRLDEPDPTEDYPALKLQPDDELPKVEA